MDGRLAAGAPGWLSVGGGNAVDEQRGEEGGVAAQVLDVDVRGCGSADGDEVRVIDAVLLSIRCADNERLERGRVYEVADALFHGRIVIPG